MEPKPIWRRLKNNKCPLCNADLIMDTAHQRHRCSKNPECKFAIGMDRFVQIVNSVYRRGGKKISEEESLSLLNNMGHEPVSEGFLPDENEETEI